jgi:hypothetical protein
MQTFSGHNVPRSTIYDFMITQCSLSIKYAQFHPVERNNEEKNSAKVQLGPKVVTN